MRIRRIPIPVAFSVVVAATVLLIIFFGAWAASADVGDPNRRLSFGIAGANSGLAVSPSSAYQGSALPGSGADESSIGEDGGWWSKAFLKACPLH